MPLLDNLAVIILNYNSYEDTISCINSIQKSKLSIQIIVVDNYSTDESYAILTKHYRDVENVTVLKSDYNGGYSYGNNFGIKYAIKTFHSKYVGVLNPDIIITDSDIFEEMCAYLEKYDKLAVVGGSTLDNKHNYNPNNSAWNIPTSGELVRYHFLVNNRKHKKTVWKKIESNLAQVECVAGCFFLAKADVFRELGYLDENVFLYNEENILGIKCKKHGYIEAVLLDKFYIHNHKQKRNQDETLMKKVTATKNLFKSTKYLCSKYYSKWLIPLLFLTEAANRCYLFLAYMKNKIQQKLFLGLPSK